MQQFGLLNIFIALLFFHQFVCSDKNRVKFEVSLLHYQVA